MASLRTATWKNRGAWMRCSPSQKHFQRAIDIFEAKGIKKQDDGKDVKSPPQDADKAVKLSSENLAICRLTVKELMLLCHEENSEWKDIKNESRPEPLK